MTAFEAFVHHRLSDGTNIWWYRDRYFWGCPTGWTDGNLHADDMDELLRTIDNDIRTRSSDG